MKVTNGRDALDGTATLNAVAGGASSAAVLVLLFPADALKTFVQTGGSYADLRRGLRRSVALASSSNGGTTTVVDAATAAAVRAYRGATPAVAEHALNRFAMFGLATVVKDRFTSPQWPEYRRDATAGFVGALVKTSVLHPLDTVKTRWQLGQPRTRLAGLYNGFAPAAVRSAGGMAVWLSTRNFLSRELPEPRSRRENGADRSAVPWVPFVWTDGIRHALAGGLASVVTDLCTFPFDTLKKSLQAGSLKNASMRAGFERLWASGGLLRFYHGYGVRLGIVMCKGAIDNWAFVTIKQLLSPHISCDRREGW